jgi:hypothetical protein
MHLLKKLWRSYSSPVDVAGGLPDLVMLGRVNKKTIDGALCSVVDLAADARG